MTNKTTVPMTLSITPEGKERLKKIAAENHTTVSGLIARWVWEYQLKTEKAEQEKQ